MVKGKHRERALVMAGEERWLPFEFLDDTHDALDHTPELHGKVFGRAGWWLIDVVDKAINSKEIWLFSEEKRLLKPYWKDLVQHLRALRYEERNGVWTRKDSDFFRV